MAHETVFDYTTIWMDSIRDGAFGLSNTNKLVRFYSGATGLKTGSTSNAGFCISATAKRDDMHLIAVIMGSESSAVRNEQAKKLLDHGFANYAVVQIPRQSGFEPVKVEGGQVEYLTPYMEQEQLTLLVGKAEKNNIECRVRLAESVTAPVEAGQTLGKLEYYCGDKLLYTVTLVAEYGVERVNFGFMLGKCLRMLLL
jgi:D-alanyl-D-alanine carboxypeptidase (penicillin-binding protein 5/6)